MRNTMKSSTQDKAEGNFHFHDLRATFSTGWMWSGGNIVALKDILGHSNLKLTRIYAHAVPQDKEDAMLKYELFTENNSLHKNCTNEIPAKAVQPHISYLSA